MTVTVRLRQTTLTMTLPRQPKVRPAWVRVNESARPEVAQARVSAG